MSSRKFDRCSNISNHSIISAFPCMLFYLHINTYHITNWDPHGKKQGLVTSFNVTLSRPIYPFPHKFHFYLQLKLYCVYVPHFRKTIVFSCVHVRVVPSELRGAASPGARVPGSWQLETVLGSVGDQHMLLTTYFAVPPAPVTHFLYSVVCR